MKAEFLTEDEFRKLMEIDEAWGKVYMETLLGHRLVDRETLYRDLKKMKQLINELVG